MYQYFKSGVILVLAVVILCFSAVSAEANITTAEDIRITSLRSAVDRQEIACTEEEEKEFVVYIRKGLQELIDAGVDPELFADVTFAIYPNEVIKTGYMNTSSDSSGLAITEYGSNRVTIVLSMTSNYRVMYHEIGHLIALKRLNAIGADWSSVNTDGRRYMNLKKYQGFLSSEYQDKLPWELRIGEWYAEDVKQYLYEQVDKSKKKDKAFKIYCYSNLISAKRTAEVDALLAKVIAPAE